MLRLLLLEPLRGPPALPVGPPLLQLRSAALLLLPLTLLLRLRVLGPPSCCLPRSFLLLRLLLRYRLLLRLLLLRRMGPRRGVGLRGPSRVHLLSLLPTGLHASLL